MIITKLYGGLGNQMFIYAFSRMLQEFYKEPIWLNTYELEYNRGGSTKRAYALDCFTLNRNCRLLNNIEKNAYEAVLQYKRRNINEEVYNQADYTKLVQNGLYTSDAIFHFYDFAESKKPIKFTDGYFMSWKYFEKIKHKLKKEFCIKIPPSRENEQLLDVIKKQNAVCVHIRRGDYVSTSYNRTNNICTESYYQKAMAYIKKRTKDPVFYVFSNSKTDITWIKRHYNFEKYNVHYVELENKDYEELRLMQNCKHFIIANSTFSWWAQYLCDNSKKIVVAPYPWLNVPDRKKKWIRDIYMPEWRTIAV